MSEEQKKPTFLVVAVLVLLGVVLVQGYFLIFGLKCPFPKSKRVLVAQTQERLDPFARLESHEGAGHENFFKEMRTLQHRIDRMFEDSFFGHFQEPVTPFGEEFFAFQPRIDMVETEKAFLVTCDMPGLDKSAIQVHLNGNVLTIEGTRDQQEEKKGKDQGWISRERHVGSFKRVISLPAMVKQDSVKAVYKDGVLKITIDKVEETPQGKTKIQVI